MLSAVHASFGEPSAVLEPKDQPLPEPGPGQVRVKMVRAAIHNHDLITVAGNYGYKPALPAIGGSEGTGVVDALGEGVTNVQAGQRVAVSGVKGAWAEFFVAQAAQLVPLPGVTEHGVLTGKGVLPAYQAAYRHSRDMADHDHFSHTGTDGSTLGARVDAAGYAWSGVGENIGAGYGSLQLALPYLPSLAGITLFTQWFVWDAGAAAGAATSRGGEMRWL